jgi:hypothetical protein
MPQGVCFGSVVHYNPEKLYGFIRDEELRKVFFHATGRGGPHVKETTYPYRQNELELVLVSASSKEVKVGDRMCFLPTRSERGLQAYVWTFESVWQQAVRELTQPRYRVICSRVVAKKGRLVGQVPEITFEGTGAEVAAKYPKKPTDALAAIDLPALKIRYSFQTHKDEGWVGCDDPRSRW